MAMERWRAEASRRPPPLAAAQAAASAPSHPPHLRHPHWLQASRAHPMTRCMHLLHAGPHTGGHAQLQRPPRPQARVPLNRSLR